MITNVIWLICLMTCLIAETKAQTVETRLNKPNTFKTFEDRKIIVRSTQTNQKLDSLTANQAMVENLKLKDAVAIKAANDEIINLMRNAVKQRHQNH